MAQKEQEVSRKIDEKSRLGGPVRKHVHLLVINETEKSCADLGVVLTCQTVGGPQVS